MAYSESGVGGRFEYERLAAEVSEQVWAGVLRPGDRLPSIRRTSRQRGVSISTVLQAYRLLEARRVIAARARSGYFVVTPDDARPRIPQPARPDSIPTPVTTGELVADVLLAAEDPSLVPLGAALPSPDLLPARALNRLMGTALRRDPGRATSFMGAAGCIELRRAIARREWEAGCPLTAEDVWITCGGNEALSLALRAATRTGDTVAVESPTYFGVLQIIEAMGCNALEIPTDPREGMSIEALRLALASQQVAAVVVTPNFQNPSGALMPDSAKHALAAIARERRIVIVEDDTFGELQFEPPRPRSILANDCDGWVIRCSTFSKSLAPGYRLGWIVPGDRFRSAVERLKHAGSIATAAPPQLAVAAYVTSPGYDRHLHRLRRILRANVERLAHEVSEQFPDDTRISRPRGGFLLWVQLPDGIDAVAAHHAARRAGVSVTPGTIFSAGGHYRDCLRLSAGHRWNDRLTRGVAALGRAVEEARAATRPDCAIAARISMPGLANR